jgi:4-diphosphocytidyl-2C-methyl-D-erythritol kinase|tara:strand:- start:979 stop:1473 length:495 start_codon:yes stop_codon:yes gene_type:complete
MADELNAVKTDIALIKKDIKQIGRFFDKVDIAVDAMSDIQKALAVQHQIITNFGDKVDNVESRVEENRIESMKADAVYTDRLEQYRLSSKEDHQRLSDTNMENRRERNAEIMEALSKLNGNLDKRISQIENRLASVEKWKWYMMGLSASVIFIITKLDIKSIIG